MTDDLTYTLRWSKEREEYIRRCNCCPPNIIRTVAETGSYAYSLSEEGLWVNIYGSNRISTTLADGSALMLVQQTGYPWDGRIRLAFETAPSRSMSLFLRIPGWCKKTEIMVNGQEQRIEQFPGTYAVLDRQWSEGDVVELILDMPVILLEANPLVEETRNQVAVKRGPLVYCLESAGLPEGTGLFDVILPSDIDLEPVESEIAGNRVIALEGEAEIIDQSPWQDTLYRDLSGTFPARQKIELIPYFAWGNRGHAEMTVWIPVRR
jgi:DUF1680 family protein